MKKITFLVLTFLFTLFSYSQTVLSYNTDDIVTTTNSVGCPSGDNGWVRNFVLSDFASLPASFVISSGSFGVQSVDETADIDVTVNIYTSTDVNFPASYATATLAGTQTVNVPMTTAVPSVMNFALDTPANIPAGTMAVIVEVKTAADVSFFIGGTASDTSDSWLKSVACNVADYVTAASIDFPDAHFYIAVTADAVTSVNDNLASDINIFPNPISDKLNVSIANSIEVNSAILFDILGKNTGIKLENGVMNTANLSAGIYLLKIETESGELTQKIIKK